MNKQELIKDYPWYAKHTNEVNTVAAFLGLEVEAVLEGLDARIRKGERKVSNSRDKKKAA